ncbi:MAG: bifunctional 23S rRNA (guanine(2069)-N(7))-methyltransferase RlmK/23S rRNA (guanine(2445)-N(2))-methyltransferase RlmL [Oceanospirillaceae bacterium]|nr:bifunctional 23S rRNA (guanine(2069)-N(7))-methyltransferase RlmK/23S rRNA (guanine(2445)-N(2))-methyltransferase RlmL [Oceanospirillaceae bacterium]MCP5350558.1 bifunctional 23S rRNA (guanine(2069)-N(7))-methyltransferase RlmK/23S rRNA (guanine(2445)-N(2))-methyltransferase RlmL [Oceanospirillaceae bacterium]
MTDKLEFIITCAKGLEPMLLEECQALGAEQAKAGVSLVRVSGDLALAYRICLWSRVASRVLYPLGVVPANTAEALYAGVKAINWLEHFGTDKTFKVFFNGSNNAFRNTHFGALKVKDAVCDLFREKTGSRPDVAAEADINIHVKINREQADVMLDLAGAPLHQRGYRQQQGIAPLKESLAAAILYRARWQELMQQGASLADPMCGSGTLLIEAAMMAMDIAPGLRRTRYGFHGWKKHQPSTWLELQNEARRRRDAGLQKGMSPMLGSDADSGVIQKAKANADRAGLTGYIQFETRDLRDFDPTSLPQGMVICNPPYGERLSDEVAIGALYQALGNRIREKCPGWQVGIFTGNPEQGYQLGMKAHKQYKFYNGAIECKLLMFDVRSAEQRSEHSAMPEQEKKLSQGSEMLANRLLKNLKKMRQAAKQAGTDCYRLYDADIPEYSLAIDVYGDWIHAQEYMPPANIPEDVSQGRLRDALDAIPFALKIPREKVVLKQRLRQKGKQQYEKRDEQARFFTVKEGNCQFYVNLTDYLDTGLFLDHRPIRTEIEGLARGKDVLNLFCYTATASVHAAVGGAASTTSVDMSQTYLNWGRRNLVLNGLPENNHSFVQADCLKWLEDNQGSPRYDLIFMDPPTFSNSKRMEGVLDVQRDHVKLISLAMSMLRKGGLLIFSNNHRRFKMEHDALKQFVIEDVTGASIPFDFARNAKIHQCFKIRHLV